MAFEAPRLHDGEREGIMASFVFVPGAGGSAWYWHRVLPLIERAGHDAIAVELPADDPDKGIHAYADVVVDAIESRRDVVLVAQSLAGFTAALVAERVRLSRLVFVNAMVPIPGETAGDWGAHTGSSEAREAAARRGGYAVEFEDQTYFLHDLPKDVAKIIETHERPEADISFAEAADFERWPDVPILVVVGKDDRLFPRDFQVRVARERLGEAARIVELPGGHLIALSRPRELVDCLLEELRG
jgi:pimeloyl-ACP methyl ester carboxylesterase